MGLWQLELIRLQQDGAFKEMDAKLQTDLAQARINEIEAAQSSLFKSGWRPAAGWLCVAGLAYEFLLRPLLPWALTVAGVHGVVAGRCAIRAGVRAARPWHAADG